MNSEKLAEILASHRLWLTFNGVSGKRANLQGENLAGVNLQNEILRDANLVRTNLQGANLTGANLQWAILEDANLVGANLQNALLRDANFWGANLQNADLRGVDLRDAILEGTNLDGAILPQNWQIVPPVGQAFTTFKKVVGGVILELLIPGSAQRTSSLIGRKCRANEALVVGVVRGAANNTGIYESLYRMDFTYEVGKMASEPAFNPDIRVECTTGIHFFMTKEEAISY